MAIIDALYQQDPFWIWLAVASVFVALNLATGSPLLMWPGVAAALIAAMDIFSVRLGLHVEALIFLALVTLLYGVLFLRLSKETVLAGAADVQARATLTGDGMGQMRQTGRLVGRIARANGEFNNGVGRVWIDEAEWGAELEGADETLPDGEPVRVTKVMGGIRLQVRPLHS